MSDSGIWSFNEIEYTGIAWRLKADVVILLKKILVLSLPRKRESIMADQDGFPIRFALGNDSVYKV